MISNEHEISKEAMKKSLKEIKEYVETNNINEKMDEILNSLVVLKPMDCFGYLSSETKKIRKPVFPKCFKVLNSFDINGNPSLILCSVCVDCNLENVRGFTEIIQIDQKAFDVIKNQLNAMTETINSKLVTGDNQSLTSVTGILETLCLSPKANEILFYCSNLIFISSIKALLEPKKFEVKKLLIPVLKGLESLGLKDISLHSVVEDLEIEIIRKFQTFDENFQEGLESSWDLLSPMQTEPELTKKKKPTERATTPQAPRKLQRDSQGILYLAETMKPEFADLKKIALDALKKSKLEASLALHFLRESSTISLGDKFDQSNISMVINPPSILKFTEPIIKTYEDHLQCLNEPNSSLLVSFNNALTSPWSKAVLNSSLLLDMTKVSELNQIHLIELADYLRVISIKVSMTKLDVLRHIKIRSIK